MVQSAGNVLKTYVKTGALSESEWHQLLTSKRRRLALDFLTDRTAPVDLEELVAEIATREDDVDATDEEAIKRVMLSLHHVHLPMAAELGVIDYDRDAGRVEACPSNPDT